MVPRTDSDPLTVQGCAYVLSLEAVEDEREHARLLRRRSDHPEAGDTVEKACRILEKAMLVRGHSVDPDLAEIVECRSQAHGVRDIARSGLKPRRTLLILSALEGDVLDHVAAALPGLRFVQERFLTVNDADSRRAKDLMPGEHEPIAI